MTVCSTADNDQLSHRHDDDAVQHHGQQLLAAGGRHLPPQPPGDHCVNREELLQNLPVHRLGWAPVLCVLVSTGGERNQEAKVDRMQQVNICIMLTESEQIKTKTSNITVQSKCFLFFIFYRDTINIPGAVGGY